MLQRSLERVPRAAPAARTDLPPEVLALGPHAWRFRRWGRPARPLDPERRDVTEAVDRKNVTTFNLYRPPNIKLCNAAEATRWLDHVRKVFGDDADHITNYFAHRAQRPWEKINHAVVLGSDGRGTGKETAIEPPAPSSRAAAFGRTMSWARFAFRSAAEIAKLSL